MTDGTRKREFVLGVGFDTLSMNEALDAAMALLAGDKPCYIVTPNPEIVQAAKDEEVRRILNNAALVLPDGIGIIKAAKILGLPIKERVAGADFAANLLPRLAGAGYPLFILGGKPGVAEEAGRRIKVTYPKLKIAGVNDGYFTDNAAICAKIKASGAKAVFVCLGAPKQEKWMAEHGEATGAALLAGLGGTIDILAGTVKRAPKLFQRFGLEWFYRLLQDPRRIGRMMKLPLFLRDVRKKKNET